MRYIVFLDAQAGEREKILSGVKRIVVGEPESYMLAEALIKPGDALYFLRDNGERTVRVQATIVRAWLFEESESENLAHHLKELQTRLCLTEDQFRYWSTRNQAFFIEFKAAQKIPAFQIAPEKITCPTRWIDKLDQ